MGAKFEFSSGPWYPRCSMYQIFPYIWLARMINVGKYTIHGSYGYTKKNEIKKKNVETKKIRSFRMGFLLSFPDLSSTLAFSPLSDEWRKVQGVEGSRIWCRVDLEVWDLIGSWVTSFMAGQPTPPGPRTPPRNSRAIKPLFLGG